MTEPKSEERKQLTEEMERFRSLSRQQKRRVIISYMGRNMNIMDYIDRRAKTMPKCNEKSTGLPMNHVKIMRSLYMEQGIKGVNDYCAMIADVTVDAIKRLQYEEVNSDGHIRDKVQPADKPKAKRQPKRVASS